MDKPLQRIDHMMWDVETPTSLVTITGMMFLKETVSKEVLSEVIRTRLLKYERFHKKIVVDKNQPVWHVDEQFDLRSHIHHIALPAPGGYAELQEVISDLISQPLDYSKPLWHVHLIDHYDGGQVILWRLHHAIADGIALIKVVFSLTGTSREESLSANIPDPIKEREEPHTWRENLGHLYHVGTDLYHDAQHLLKDPKLLKDTLSESWEAVKDLKNLFAGPSLEGNIYKGALSVSKKAAWSKPLPLDRIKQIGKLYHATVNDVLLSIMTGAVRRHLLAHDQPVDKGLRVVCPVNIRKKEEAIKVHNKIGMLSLELPVQIAGQIERIAYIREKTSLLKHSWEPFIVYNLLTVLADIIPKDLEQKFAGLIGEKIVGVVTNVPGPRDTIYMAGAQVEDLMFWVPQTGPLGIGVSIISYDGKVYVGLVTDSNLVSDPDQIIAGFYQEYEILESLLDTAGHRQQ